VATERSGKRKGKGANPAGLGGDVCCNHDCVECCASADCPEHEVCNDQHQCVTGCGTGPACTGGLTCCGDGDAAQCVDTGSDNNNCGTCGHICPENTACGNGTCNPTCAASGASCASLNCCAPLVCGTGNICRPCTPDGEECSLAECCSADFTCKKSGKHHKHICVKAGGGGGGGDGGNGNDCAHVGDKPLPGHPCCPRLHEEKGRCVINRWDHCDQSNHGQASWCEHGTTCEGGRISPHHQEVCVPKGYRRWLDREDAGGQRATTGTAPQDSDPD
jgi:hypothetical protein